MAKSDYTTLTTPGTKKISVCERRLGSRDRMTVIALCTSEVSADKIVDGLNILQGKVAEIEVPAQRVLAEVRASLATERGLVNALRRDVSDRDRTIRDLKQDLERAKRLVPAQAAG